MRLLRITYNDNARDKNLFIDIDKITYFICDDGDFRLSVGNTEFCFSVPRGGEKFIAGQFAYIIGSITNAKIKQEAITEFDIPSLCNKYDVSNADVLQKKCDGLLTNKGEQDEFSSSCI